MNIESILPKDFDGNFPFTNFTDTEFVAKWNNKEYIFPPNSTTKLIVLEATVIETQAIRKKFARELAERELLKSDSVKRLDAMNTQALNSFRNAVTYSPSDLDVYVQRCLEPLPIAQMIVTESPRMDQEAMMKKDEKGNTVTRIVDDKSDSLVGNGQIVA